MGAQHSSRRELAGEHAFTDIGQLILYAVFLITWITDSLIFHYSVFLAVYVPAYIRVPAGIAILIASTLLALSAHKALFGEPEGKSGVIATGAFSLVRHPMYLGSWLFSVGLAITMFSASSALVSLAILVFYCHVARYEERLLLRKFGEEYRQYQARVPMFAPFKFKRKRLARVMGSGPRSTEVPSRIR
jgi:protein-S-isoprenylcysteine O-methyltransferase Ste14